MIDNTVGNRFKDSIKLAYIAGFLDGDGAISATIERHSEKKYKFRVRVSLDFYQHRKNLKVLQYIKDYLGEGYLGRSIRNTHKLSLRNQKTLKEILPALYEFTVIKKRQTEIALKILNTNIVKKSDLIRVAKLSDRLSSFNIRSKSRRKNNSKIILNLSSND